jgi:hypothetical protein
MCTKRPIIVHSQSSDAEVYTIDKETFLQHAIKQKIVTLNDENGNKIHDKPITIKVQGKHCNDLVLVDLPGLTVAQNTERYDSFYDYQIHSV